MVESMVEYVDENMVELADDIVHKLCEEDKDKKLLIKRLVKILCKIP
jgi:hypothetical protein